MIIGLTGGIASGKSTVSNILIDLGIVVIDADKIAREVVKPNEEAYIQIVKHFGNSILEPDGAIARKKLGAIIFNDPKERECLNEIVHPAVRKKIIEKKDSYLEQGEKVIVYDIPLLFESKLEHMVNKIILVYVDKEIQLNRLMNRDNITKKEALSRIQSQMPIDEKISKADEVINNNGTREETKLQLISILKKWEVKV